LGWTGALGHSIRTILYLVALLLIAAPALAAVPPVPQSRPVLQRLEAPAGEARANGAEAAKLHARLATRLRALSKLLAKAGLNLDQLVADATPAGEPLSEGLGGPLIPAAGRNAGRAAERYAAAEIDRLRRMQHVRLAVPVAAPMVEYKLNSGFGYRRDPMRRRGALHTGIDLGGPRNAPVLATAPGTVVETGRSGAYGIMVVVDHGMGLETRYAHLSRARVRVGDKVAVGKTVGLMGRTGRATGPHLHYEIRFDGRPLSPRPFIEAGAKLQLASD
jgi:murein DD-endopeptidase MepM/ murein hydrolase activator NlpD